MESMGNAVPSQVAEDEQLSMSLREQMIGAAERATFHRCEAEKFLRIARGAAAGLAELSRTQPVEGVDSDQLFDSALKEREGPKVGYDQATRGEGVVYSN